jgi:hypothetical protein
MKLHKNWSTYRFFMLERCCMWWTKLIANSCTCERRLPLLFVVFVCYLDFVLSLDSVIFFNNPFTLFLRYSVDYIWSTMEQSQLLLHFKWEFLKTLYACLGLINTIIFFMSQRYWGIVEGFTRSRKCKEIDISIDIIVPLYFIPFKM